MIYQSYDYNNNFDKSIIDDGTTQIEVAVDSESSSENL